MLKESKYCAHCTKEEYKKYIEPSHDIEDCELKKHREQRKYNSSKLLCC